MPTSAATSRRRSSGRASNGALPPGPDAGEVAASLLAVMDGLQTQWLLDESFDMAAAFDAHLVSIGARLDAR